MFTTRAESGSVSRRCVSVPKSFNESLRSRRTPAGLRELISRTKEPILQTAILRSCPVPATLRPTTSVTTGCSTRPTPHHVPIRRYPDLLLHRAHQRTLLCRHLCRRLVPDGLASGPGLGRGQAGKRGQCNAGREAPQRNLGSASAFSSAGGAPCRCTPRRGRPSQVRLHASPHASVTRRSSRDDPRALLVALKDIAVDGFIHISNLGWGYYEFDEKNLTMTSREGDDAGARRRSALIVRLEGSSDLQNRRRPSCQLNLERRLKAKGARSRRSSDAVRGLRRKFYCLTLMVATTFDGACSARKAMTTGTIEPVSS